MVERYLANEMFIKAFNDAAIGMALVGLDGKWLNVNDSLCKIVGYSREELLNTDFQSITHQDDLTRDLSQATALLLGHIPSSQVEKRYFHKSGRIIWVMVTGTLVRKRDGTPDFFIAQIQDITRAKRDAAERDAFFRLSHSLLAVLSSHGQLTRINPCWTTTLGWDSADIEQMSFLDLIDDESRDALAADITSCRAGNKTRPRTVRIRRKSGDCCVVEFDIIKYGSEDMLLNGKDVTEEQSRADFASATFDLLREVADHVPAVLGYLDANLINRYASARYEDWFGMKPEQIQGKHLSEYAPESWINDRPFIDAALRGEQQMVRNRLSATKDRPALDYVAYLTPDLRNGRVQGIFILALEERASDPANQSSATPANQPT